MISKEDGFDLHLKWHFPEARQYSFTFIILFITLAIIYGNSFDCEFHFDDFPNIVDNTNVHLKSLSWENIKKTFYEYGRNKISRPLSYLSFALNYYIHDANVFGYHLVNFTIHYVASVFLFLFIYNTLKLPILREKYDRLAYSVGLLSVFLWATHPLQVTAVTYIVQRMTSMAGMFYIMAMYFYLKGRISDSRKKKIGFIILCGISAVLSFASKQNAAMLPLSLFLYDLFLIQGVTRKSLKYNLKLFILPITIILFLGTLYTDIKVTLDGYDLRLFTLTERLLTQPRVILFYISLLLYPADSRLTLLYDIELSKSVFTPWATLPAILIIIILIGIALRICQKFPLIAYCILFFFINHLIEGSVIPLELIYEHRNYLPSMMFFIPVAIFMIKVISYFSYKKTIRFMMVFVFTFILSSQAHSTYFRNNIFKNEFTIWLDNTEKSPNLSRPHNNLGKYYADIGLEAEALEEFEESLRLNNFSRVKSPALYHYNIGMYHLRKRVYDQAMEHFLISKDIYSGNPHPRTLYGLAITHYKLGNLAEAQKFIQEALSKSPFSANYHMILSLILLESGDTDASIEVARKSLELDPGYDKPLMILAEAFKRKGKYSAAVQYWEKFLQKYPTYIKGHLALVELFSITGENMKLNRIIGRVMYLKGEKTYLEVMCEQPRGDEIVTYIPEPEVLLPVIRKSLSDQSKELANVLP
ncbi:tetratricopeptide repeat protein [Desulfococcaceae bacterium HSG8]|nr:tetratricopeptide repeat protein [Desulfococcaceae bacterium HSG8]